MSDYKHINWDNINFHNREDLPNVKNLSDKPHEQYELYAKNNPLYVEKVIKPIDPADINYDPLKWYEYIQCIRDKNNIVVSRYHNYLKQLKIQQTNEIDVIKHQSCDNEKLFALGDERDKLNAELMTISDKISNLLSKINQQISNNQNTYPANNDTVDMQKEYMSEIDRLLKLQNRIQVLDTEVDIEYRNLIKNQVLHPPKILSSEEILQNYFTWQINDYSPDELSEITEKISAQEKCQRETNKTW